MRHFILPDTAVILGLTGRSSLEFSVLRGFSVTSLVQKEQIRGRRTSWGRKLSHIL